MNIKKNDLQEIKKQGSSAISAKISELQAEYRQNTLKVARGEIKNTRDQKNSRRAIARLKTYLKEGAK